MDLGIALGQFVVTILSLFVGGVWWLGRLEHRILEEAEKRMKMIEDRAEAADRDIASNLTVTNAGIAHLNMWTRDTFVRREDFYPVLENVNHSIQALGANVDNRMTRLEGKIDKLAGLKNEGTE